jgi:two-component system response regulator
MTKKAKARKVRSDAQVRLGAVVRACRHRLGLTQDELGSRSNLHRTYIADVERGARNVTLRSIINLAKALEVTVGNMLSHAADAGVWNAGSHDSSVVDVSDILLVEESATDAALTERVFKRARITNRLRIARSAEDAMAILLGASGSAKRNPVRPRLILLGLKLPGMSGLELLRKIKADRRTRDVPIVVLANSWSDKAIIESGRLGVQNHIIKPFSIESLVRVAPKLDLHLTLGAAAHPKHGR